MFITANKKSKSDLVARRLFNFSRFLPRSYHSRPQIIIIVTFVLYTTDVGYKWLNVNFSTGGFKPFTTCTKSRREKPLSQEVEADTASQAKSAMEAFSCPKEGCVRVFQRFSSLERHLSSERCSKSLERQSLLDLAKTKYASRLEEGVGKMPTLKSLEPLECEETVSIVEEG